MTETAQNQIAQELDGLKEKFDLLLYVGRFCPMHVGHQAMIGGMVKAFPENHIVMIGSCNEPMSMRNLFSYGDRHDFIAEKFPSCRVVGIPDFGDDSSWFKYLDDLIALAGGNPETTAFIGGCREDVEWYYRTNRQVHIVNRFSGTTTNVSGTEIRDHLISRNRERLIELIDPQIIDIVQERFDLRWDEFRRK